MIHFWKPLSLYGNDKDHSEEGRRKGSFVSDYVFNLNKKINVLEKGLGFSPTPFFTNEADWRRDFNEFSRKVKCKLYFRNETTEVRKSLHSREIYLEHIILYQWYWWFSEKN